MTRNLTRVLFSIFTILTIVMPVTARAEALSFSNSEKFSTNYYVYDSCTTEWVWLSGDVHANYHVNWNGNSYHVDGEYNPQGVSGIGSSSGNGYHLNGVYRFSLEATSPGQTYSYADNFRLITSGPGNNYVLRFTYHVTVNANGVVTSVLDNFSIGCQ